MGNDNLLPYLKARAADQAKLHAGRSSFLQTADSDAAQLETIVKIRGPTRKAVIIDLVPLLFEFHGSIVARGKAGWLLQPAENDVWSTLDQKDEAWVTEHRKAFQDVLGNDTLFVYVVDGDRRPVAKSEELAARHRRSEDRRKRENVLPSGLKTEDIKYRSGDTRRRWMTSTDDNVVFLVAPQEADWLIQHLLTQSVTPPTCPAPQHNLYETAEIDATLTKLRGFDPLDRITVTRDSDDAALLTARERGWCLLTRWSGKLQSIGLDQPAAAAAPAASSSSSSSSNANAANATASSSNAAAAASSANANAACSNANAASSNANAASSSSNAASSSSNAASSSSSNAAISNATAASSSSNAALASTSGVSSSSNPNAVSSSSSNAVSSSSKAAAGAGPSRTCTRTLPARLHMPPTRAQPAAPHRRSRVESLDYLPRDFGNSILLFGPGLDALAGFGSDRERRIRAWALTGNDYRRNGVVGVTRTVFASGLLDDLFAGPWSRDVLQAELSRLLKRLSSTSDADHDWRGSGAQGRLQRGSSELVPDEVVDGVFEAYRIARGADVELMDRDDFRALPPAVDLDDKDIQPRMSRAVQPARTGVDAQGALHPYRGRPGQSTDPAAASPTTTTNPRSANPIQSRQRHEGQSRPSPNSFRIRPRAPGPSVALAALHLEPELEEPTPEQYEKRKDAQEQYRERAAAKAAKQKQYEEEKKAKEDDDELEITEDEPGQTRLGGFDSVYQASSSHEIALKAICRNLSTTEAPVAAVAPVVEAVAPVAADANDAEKDDEAEKDAEAEDDDAQDDKDVAAPAEKRKNRSGARQKAAKRYRLTHAPMPDTTSAPASKPTAPAADPPPIPPEVTNLYAIIRFYVLAAHLAVRFGHAAATHLMLGRLERNEAGVQLLAKEVVPRSALSGLAARLTCHAMGEVPSAQWNNSEEEQAAIRATLDAGLVPPPRAAVGVYTQLFVHWQTAVAQSPENRLVDDLRSLGRLLGEDPAAQFPFALAHVFRVQHQGSPISASTEALLSAAATAAPDASSRFGSSLAGIFGDALAGIPFSFARARAGTADVANSGLESPFDSTRSSKRESTVSSSTRTKQLQAGLVDRRIDDEGNPTAASENPATEADFELDPKQSAKLREAIARFVGALSAAAQTSSAGIAVTATTEDEIEREFLAGLFRLCAYRDRATEIAINLCDSSKPESCEGLTLEALLAGGGYMSKETFGKSMIGFAMRVRQMRGLQHDELLPTYDPKWIPTTVIALVRLSSPQYLGLFLSDLEAQATRMAQHFLPRLDDVQGHQAEILAAVRDLFDIHRWGGMKWSWREAELAGARARPGSGAMAAVTSVDLRTKPSLRAQAESLVPTLQRMFGLDEKKSVARWIERNHATAEVLHRLFRTHLLPPNFLATGFFHTNSTTTIFVGVKLDRANKETIDKYKGKDAGEVWSEVSQLAHSKMVLGEYYTHMRPAFDWRRTETGSWTSSRIEPIAEPGAAEMLSRRGAASSRMPVNSQTQMKIATLQERTKDGLPLSIGDISDDRTRQKLNAFVQGVPSEQRNYGGFDLGQAAPVAAYISKGSQTPSAPPAPPVAPVAPPVAPVAPPVAPVAPPVAPVAPPVTPVAPPVAPAPAPTAAAAPIDNRAEATLIYSRGTVLNMQREHNRRSSHLNTNLASQLDIDRCPLSYPPPPTPLPPPAPPPPPLDLSASSMRTRALREILQSSRPSEPRGGRSSRSESRSSSRTRASSRANAVPTIAGRRRCRSVPRPQDPPPPTTDAYRSAEAPSNGPLFDTWCHVLKILHPVAAAERSRQKTEYEREMRRAAVDFVRAVRGGQGRESQGKWIFFVGKETAPKGGGHGPAPATRLIRQIKTEMEAQRLPAFFARIDEYGTSKHCAHPWCVDADKRRSEARTIKRKDGSTCYRVVRCVQCHDTFHRDGAAAANMISQASESRIRPQEHLIEMLRSAELPGQGSAAFLAKQHILFSLRHAKYLPTPYQAEDNNRMTLAYFCLASLALLPSSAVASTDESLSALEVMLKPAQIQGFRDWVYEQQMPAGGFRGSDALAAAGLSAEQACTTDPANVIQTYTALCVLGLLGDDYSRLDRSGLKRFLGECQNEDGSFSQFPGCEEPGDPRSSYSAFAVASMLDEWDFIDVDQGLAFLECCRSYEGAYAQRPGLEANAGPTYCAIAAYSLASRLHTIPEPDDLLRWLVDRQVPPPPSSPSETDSDSETEGATAEAASPDAPPAAAPTATGATSDAAASQQSSSRTTIGVAGFQGRANKPTDACYSFWNTAALTILIPAISPKLTLPDLVDPQLDRAWLLSCQHPVFGGIAREQKALPDVYHTYLSLAALSLGAVTDRALDLRRLDPAWNVPVAVAASMRTHLWQDSTRDFED